MDDRKKLKEAIKTIIRKSLVSDKKGKGVMKYDTNPVSSDVLSYTEGGFLESLDRLKPFFDIFTKYIVPNYDKPRKGKGVMEYDIPPFDDDDYEGGLVAEGMRKRKGKALVANGLVAEGMRKKGRSLVAEGLIAEGLVAEGMRKRKGKALVANGLIGLAQQPAELPYTELYGQGICYDRHGNKKEKGAPRGDKGAALKKFNDIVRQLRAKDSSMTLAEARSKAKTIYRS